MTMDAPLVPPSAVAPWLEELPRPVAITGGTGFVGSHLVDTLCAAGIRPRVLVRDPERPRWIADRAVDWVEGDLEDDAALSRLVAGAGAVLHLAGLVRAVRVEEFDRVNRGGTARLVKAVEQRAPESRFALVSSLAAAGPSPRPHGIGPEAEPHPVSAYGRSKLAAEHELRRLGEGGWWCVLRPPAIYGPRDTDVLEFFRMAARGLMARPSGERWITVAFVADVVRAVLAAVSSGERGRCYHLGEPEPRRLGDLMHAIADAGGKKVRILSLPAALVSAVGVGADLAGRLGLRSALTRDKACEIVARHWTARTLDSLVALGLREWVEFPQGAADTWSWYRAECWLR